MTRPLLALWGLAILLGPRPAPAADAPVSFRKDVAPILVGRCLSCHNEKKAANTLDLSTFARLKAGGKAHKAEILVPGDPEASYLVESLKADADPRMPFQLPPLKPAEIATIEAWVKQGARFDAGSETTTRLATLVDPLAELPQVAVRPGVSDPAVAVAFTPDVKRTFVASGKVVQEFDASGKLARTLAGHDGLLTGLIATPDGSHLIGVGGRPGLFGSWTAWDLRSGKPVHSGRGHTDQILSAALSSDGKHLATGSYDRLVTTREWAKDSPPRPFREHTDAVHAVAFSPDGTLLATAGADRNVKLWDVASGKRLVSLADATGELYALAFSPDGTTLHAGGVDRSIRAYRIQKQGASLARSAFAHDGPILKLVVSQDGKTLISSSEDRTVRIWDVASLTATRILGPFPDWPQSLALTSDGKTLAIGRYDGAVDLIGVPDGSVLQSLVARRVSTASTAPAKSELVRPASLNPISPRGAKRGSIVTIPLSGNGIGRANRILLDDPGISARILRSTKPDSTRIDVELKVAPDARLGGHRLLVQTPLGIPPAQSFAVTAFDEVPEAKAAAIVSKLPATLVGTIDTPGDVDEFELSVTRGSTIVFDVLSRSLGSPLEPIVSLFDPSGRILAESNRNENGGDPVLIYQAPADAKFKLRVADALLTGSGNHAYRIQAGTLPVVTSSFPLGVEAGKAVDVALVGGNIPSTVTVKGDASPGTTIPLSGATGGAITGRSVLVARGPQQVEGEDSDARDSAVRVATPGGLSGRISRPGDVDFVRFSARKGETWIVEIQGRRLGSPIDPIIEILDAQGKPVPRAILRRLFETQVAFRDHPAANRAIRLTHWDSLQMGDYLWAGRELLRLHTLPRNPDDDAIFWGLGIERVGPGERMGMLETTPEHHPLSQPLEKVEILPPGSPLPSGGKPPIILNYRNDDGGPGIGKDSRVTFRAPADGEYSVRIEDVRGLGGPEFGYHLLVRRPEPGFQLLASNENPNIPRGGNVSLTVEAIRKDGFDSPIEVEAFDLPSGVTSTRTIIEPDAYAAELLLMASDNAPEVSPPTWKLRARAVSNSGSHEESWTILDPGGPVSGFITVIPRPNLEITASPQLVTIAPGQRIEMTFKVKRGPAFAGRVPINVRNLPHGVRVLNIGLNGVLVTETQTERTVFLYAEPWVRPQERVFFASGKAESAGTEHPSGPIRLRVAPHAAASR